MSSLSAESEESVHLSSPSDRTRDAPSAANVFDHGSEKKVMSSSSRSELGALNDTANGNGAESGILSAARDPSSAQSDDSEDARRSNKNKWDLHTKAQSGKNGKRRKRPGTINVPGAKAYGWAKEQGTLKDIVFKAATDSKNDDDETIAMSKWAKAFERQTTERRNLLKLAVQDRMDTIKRNVTFRKAQMTDSAGDLKAGVSETETPLSQPNTASSKPQSRRPSVELQSLPLDGVPSNFNSARRRSSAQSTISDKSTRSDRSGRRRASMLAQAVSKRQMQYLGRGRLYWRMEKLINSTAFGVLMTLATVWALFGTDLSRAAFPKEADYGLAVLMFVVFLAFAFELCTLSWVQKESYFLHFFFFMDLIALISLVPDILPVFGVDFEVFSAVTLARAGRAARAAARTARLARVAKLMELKTRQSRDRERLKWLDEQGLEEREVTEITEEIMEPSVVGEHISDDIFKKMFFLVLLLFIVLTTLPALIPNSTLQDHAKSGLVLLSDTYFNSPGMFANALSLYRAAHPELLQYVVNNTVAFVDAGRESSLREEDVFVFDCEYAFACEAKFDGSSIERNQAIADMCSTFFVIFLLVAAQTLLNNNLSEVVVKPVERMVAVVKLLALNPLATLHIKEDFNFETGMLESMLTKIGVLLQIGFGAAGTQIIQQNLSASGQLVPIVPGRRMHAIFGFCDIRRFTSITEILQQDVMIFVNAIAEIVHGAVAARGGFPNKNIGDAFLMVWNMPERKRYDKEEWMRRNTHAADNALMSFIEARDALRQSPALQDFVEVVPGLDYVRMGYGLHVGYAIAGAIGSRMKVDASYLSPNVNLSARLESATKQYGVELLMSHQFFELLSPDMQKRCVLLDRAMMVGVKRPVGLYTVVLDTPERSGFKLSDWRLTFSAGVELYLGGSWAAARTRLEQSLEMHPGWKPASVVLEFMQQRDFRVPENWAGFRDLAEK